MIVGRPGDAGGAMGFYEVLDRVVALLRERGRLTYRGLKREFELDDACLEDLKHELIDAQRVAVDEQAAILVWTGAPPGADPGKRQQAEAERRLHTVLLAVVALLQRELAVLPADGGVPHAPEDLPVLTSPEAHSGPEEGERRQLTVLFCDPVGSTQLSADSTRKTCVRWWAPTTRPRPRSSSSTRAISPSISVMACWSISAIPRPMKTMPGARFEELTKVLLASALLREEAGQYVLTGPLRTVSIPDTLQDALMARLDQLPAPKEVAQLGAVLGREFTYELVRSIAPQDENRLIAALEQLVAAELLYQRGRPPKARYVFKHALIQDAAYASLLKGTRQQLHQRTAQVLEAQFSEVVATQPELLAHHLTEAGHPAQAVAYWQRAGERAVGRSANLEAISHLTTGLAVLQALPETAERTQQELLLQITLGPALMNTEGFAAPEAEHAYARARALCQRVGETPSSSPSCGDSGSSTTGGARTRRRARWASSVCSWRSRNTTRRACWRPTTRCGPLIS